jgi:diguanylate cyclase (GGDEF)-like protein
MRDELRELHWMLGILQHVDVGLVVLDRGYRIRLWNGFMENHSGVRSVEALHEVIFELFPDLPRQWLKRKLDSVFVLQNRTFTTWQQRPFLFRFESYRAITSGAEWMFQNVTFMPLVSVNGEVEHVCLIVYDVTDVALDERELVDANQRLEQLRRIDGLTGLYNRAAWEELLHMEFQRLRRNLRPSALVMFDIDHFKRVNDTYGHPVGDEVIRRVAATLSSTKRVTDVAGRYGGEEFAVILVDSDREGGLRFAERLRQRVAADVWRHGHQEIRCTISLGLAEFRPGFAEPAEWVAQADAALYRSKTAGRNRTTEFSP